MLNARQRFFAHRGLPLHCIEILQRVHSQYPAEFDQGNSGSPGLQLAEGAPYTLPAIWHLCRQINSSTIENDSNCGDILQE